MPRKILRAGAKYSAYLVVVLSSRLSFIQPSAVLHVACAVLNGLETQTAPEPRTS